MCQVDRRERTGYVVGWGVVDIVRSMVGCMGLVFVPGGVGGEGDVGGRDSKAMNRVVKWRW